MHFRFRTVRARKRRMYPIHDFSSPTFIEPNTVCFQCGSDLCAGTIDLRECHINLYRQALADEYNAKFPKGPKKYASDFAGFEVITKKTLKILSIHYRTYGKKGAAERVRGGSHD